MHSRTKLKNPRVPLQLPPQRMADQALPVTTTQETSAGQCRLETLRVPAFHPFFVIQFRGAQDPLLALIHQRPPQATHAAFAQHCRWA